ncbi:hypothetical protein DID80_02815 [Candidatus Marinamargulisbacteria bacterium SCGC AAA071-K20]|nr:hypothetical protein DID80_02815 [Candidatus Marinamargulisbacteria bacterium SCGC AAA071-K20]
MKSFLQKSIIISTFLLQTLIFGSVYDVGYSEEIITPSKQEIASGEIYLGGYGVYKERGPATGIKDDIYAKSMVIQEGESIIVITSLDLPGISNKVLKEIRKGVYAQTKIPKENLFIGATHTHAGPDLMGLWGGVTDTYKKIVIDKTTAAIINAYNKMEPSRLYISTTSEENLNRRGLEITDDSMSVIDAISLSTGTRIATMVNFGTHPIFVDEPEVSRDYCGYLVDYVSERLGGPVLFVNGIMGDVVPPKNVDSAKDFGETLGKAVVMAVSDSKEIEPDLVINTTVWKQKISNPIFILAAGLSILDFDISFNPFSGFEIETRASYFRLGTQVQGVTFPGESLTQNGLSIKDQMKAPSKLFFGLTGETLGYFIPSYDWNVPKNNYEEILSMGKDVGDIIQTKLTMFIKEDNTQF